MRQCNYLSETHTFTPPTHKHAQPHTLFIHLLHLMAAAAEATRCTQFIWTYTGVHVPRMKIKPRVCVCVCVCTRMQVASPHSCRCVFVRSFFQHSSERGAVGNRSLVWFHQCRRGKNHVVTAALVMAVVSSGCCGSWSSPSKSSLRRRSFPFLGHC